MKSSTITPLVERGIPTKTLAYVQEACRQMNVTI